jgi:L-threonylcarbamoyladenylate synthase
MSETISIERDGPARAREALEGCVIAGDVAVFPADTVYGLACDPLNSEAVERVHALKGRAEDKPSAVMFFSPLVMRELLATLGPRTRDAIGALLPGPVTLVVANPERRYPLACREDPERLGIRLIQGPLAGAGCTVLQTSANPSGDPPPRTVGAIAPRLVGGADLVIDAGELPGTASTVVDVAEVESGGPWRVLREGAVSSEELQRRLAGAGIVA